MGIMLPDKNAFEFVHRPQKREQMSAEKKKDGESGKAKIQKRLLQMKRANTKSSSSSKEMATVKLSF
jgi:hypothetical protein